MIRVTLLTHETAAELINELRASPSVHISEGTQYADFAYALQCLGAVRIQRSAPGMLVVTKADPNMGTLHAPIPFGTAMDGLSRVHDYADGLHLQVVGRAKRPTREELIQKQALRLAANSHFGKFRDSLHDTDSILAPQRPVVKKGGYCWWRSFGQRMLALVGGE